MVEDPYARSQGLGRKGAIAVVVGVVAAVVGAIVLIVVLHARNDHLSPPSRAASERALTSGVADAIHEPVAVRCQTPSTDGWTCLLRAADGRYGSATGSLSGSTVTTPMRHFSYTSTHVHYTFTLSVAADGTVDVTLPGVADATTPDSADVLDVEAGFVVTSADDAVDSAASTLHCPALAPSATVTCTRTLGPAVQVTRDNAGTERFRFTEPLPGSAGYRRDTSLPTPPAVPAH